MLLRATYGKKMMSKTSKTCGLIRSQKDERLMLQILICFLILIGSASATGARQDLRSDVSYSEGNQREGRYKYGYAVKEGETQFHHQRSLDGAVYGCYGFVDPLGKLFITHYLADMAGYRLVNMANPDKKLLERIQSLGSADHPIELQSFFPLECQGDGNIKVLQETAAQMRSSLRSTPNGHARSTSNQQSSGASLEHSGKTSLKSSDHVLVKTSESTATDVTLEKAIHQQSETSHEETVVHDVEQSTVNILDSTVQSADVSMEVDTANQRKNSIDSSKTSDFGSHSTKGNRFAGGLHSVDNPRFIRVKVVYDNEDSQATRKRPNVKAETEGSPSVESKGSVRTSFEAPGSSDELNENDAKFKQPENMRKSELLIVPADVINNDYEQTKVTQSVEMEHSTEINLQLSKNALSSDRGHVTYGVSSSSTKESDTKVSGKDEAGSILSFENIAFVDGSLIARSAETESQQSSESVDFVNSENTENVELRGLKATVKDDTNFILSSKNVAAVDELLATDSPLQAERELSSENMGVIDADNTQNVELSRLKTTVKDETSSVLRSENIADVKGSLILGSVLQTESQHSSEGMGVVNSENTEGVEISGLKATVKDETGSILGSQNDADVKKSLVSGSVSQAQHSSGSMGSENAEHVELSGLKASVKDETSSILRFENVAEVNGSLATGTALQAESQNSFGSMSTENNENVQLSRLKATANDKDDIISRSDNVAEVEGSLATRSALQVESQHSSKGMGVIHSQNTEHIETRGLKATVNDKTISHLSYENDADVKGALAARAALQAESQLSSKEMSAVNAENSENIEISGLKFTVKDETSSIFSSEHVADVKGSLATGSELQAESQHGSERMGVVHVVDLSRSKIMAQSSIIRNKATAGLKSHSNDEKHSENDDESVKLSAQNSNSMFRGRVKYNDYASSSLQPAGLQGTKTSYSYNSGQYKPDNRGSFKPSSTEASSRESFGQPSFKTSNGAGIRDVLGSDGRSTVPFKSGSSNGISGTQLSLKSNTDTRGSIKSTSVSTNPGVNTIESVQRLGNIQESDRKYSESFNSGQNGASSGNIKGSVGTFSVSSNSDSASKSTVKTSNGNTGTGGKGLMAIRVSGSVKSSEIDGSPQVLGQIKKTVNKSSESFKSGSHITQNNHRGLSSNQPVLKSVQDDSVIVKADHDAGNVHESNIKYSMPLKTSKHVGTSGNIKSTGSSSQSSNSESSSQSTLGSSTETGGKQILAIRVSGSYDNSKRGGSSYSGQVLGDSKGSVRSSSESFKSVSNNGDSSNHLSLESSKVKAESDTAAIQVQDDGVIVKADHDVRNVHELNTKYSMPLKTNAHAGSSGSIKNTGSSSQSSNLDSSSKSTLRSSAGNSEPGGLRLSAIRGSGSFENSKKGGSSYSGQVLGDIKGSVRTSSEPFKSGSHNGESSNQQILESSTVKAESDMAAIHVQDDGVNVKVDHDEQVHELNAKYSMPLKSTTSVGSSGYIKSTTGSTSEVSNLDSSSQLTLKSSTGDTEIGGKQLSAIRGSGSFENSRIGGSTYSGQGLGDIKASVRTPSERFKSGSHNGESSNQQILESSTVKTESDTVAIHVQDDGVNVKADYDVRNVYELNTKYSMPLKSNTNVGSSGKIKSTADSSSEVSNLDSSSQLTLRSSTGDTEISGKQLPAIRGSGSFENSKIGDSTYSGQVLGDIKASVRTSSESFKSGSHNGKSSNQQILESSTVKAEYDTAAIQVQDDRDVVNVHELNTKHSMPLKSSTNAGSFGKIKSTSGSFSDSSSQSTLRSSSGETETGGKRLTAVRGSGSFESSKIGGSPYSGQVLGDIKGAVRTSSESFKSGSNNGESLSEQVLKSPTVKVKSDTAANQVQDGGMFDKAGDSSLSSEVVGEIKESVESILKQGPNVIQSADFGVSSSKSVQAVTVHSSADQDLELSKSSTNIDGSSASQSTFKSPAVEVAHGTMLRDNKNSHRSSSGSFQQNSNVQSTHIGGSASQLTSQSSTLEVVSDLPVVDSAKAADSNQDLGHIRVSQSVGHDGRSSQSTFKSSSVENVPALRRIPAIRVPEYVEQRIRNAASSKVPVQPSQEYGFATRSSNSRPVESKITSVSNFGASVKRTDIDDSVVVEVTDEDTQRSMIPKLPATPRTTIAGSSEPVTVASSITSYSNKPPVHPHPTTGYRPTISNVYYQAGATTTTTVKPEPPARSTVGPSGDVYDEIDEDPAPPIAPISASHPTQMSPQIPSIPNSGSGITIHPSIASNCYEVILQIPADAKQVLLKTESSAFRVYGDSDPYNRVKLVQPGVYEVNIAATSGIKFQQYQNYPQDDASKLQLDLGKGFNYGELVPTPANREAIDHRDPTLNNPYLPQVTIEKARSVGSAEVVTVGEDSHELTVEQRALLNLVPSWKKVLQNY